MILTYAGLWETVTTGQLLKLKMHTLSSSAAAPNKPIDVAFVGHNLALTTSEMKDSSDALPSWAVATSTVSTWTKTQIKRDFVGLCMLREKPKCKLALLINVTLGNLILPLRV
ncbi:hypothetical protein DD237_003779 [Peronospora effusa]|uniref:Uncharacterized protein n=1 Tax=Peronospora effusa TaxID=542832 RepID=A0A425C916_9STRA|nr:hypothetical protein DD237_003779 [Peronospora effusa]